MLLFFFNSDCDGDTFNCALVQYTFDEEEYAILLGPHGNSKKTSAYLRTMPSTLQKLHKVSRNLTPKFAACEVSSSAGDIITASHAGSLPRNRQQVSNMRRHTELSCDPSTSKQKDPLFSVVMMCKNSEGCKSNESFVHIVTGAPEPMVVLCPEWTLNDLDRFCTGSPHAVLTLDPTFDLGDFNVTISTYRQFFDWFVANCKEAVKTSMLKPVRVAAGLGNPPQPYYTNDVESHNNVIKM